GKRTTDQGRFLTCQSDWRSQLRAQRRIFAGFPLNRPRSARPRTRSGERWMGGTLVDAVARAGRDGLSNSRRRSYAAAMTSTHTRLLALLSAIVVAAALRLVPHPPNFTPIAAMALFSGASLRRRSLAFVAPFAAMLLSDAVLGFHPFMWATYSSVALIVLIGWAVQARITVFRVGMAAVASSVLFF